MTTRRRMLAILGMAVSAYPWVARSQPATKMPHIGYLSTGSLKSNRAFLDALRDALRELGYIDGKNIAIDVRWAGDMPSEFPQLAASLVRANPDALITTCIPSTRGFTRPIPTGRRYSRGGTACMARSVSTCRSRRST